MEGHDSRVCSLSWNGSILCSGSQTGKIILHDVKIANHHIATLNGHTQEVCGLDWSPDGRLLASGGNDNLVQVWCTNTSTSSPVHTLTEHQSAVKALTWCPWKSTVLTTGGGTADRTVRLWDVNTGLCTKTVQVDSQVTGLVWNREYRELLSGHGYPSYQLSIWKYPSMNKVQDLIGHTMRVLNVTMSPCGQYVMSSGADESLRLWHCFKVDPTRKKLEQKRRDMDRKVDVSGQHSFLKTIR